MMAESVSSTSLEQFFYQKNFWPKKVMKRIFEIDFLLGEFFGFGNTGMPVK